MSWTIYHHPRCRKSRETLALLEAGGVKPRIVLYQQDPPGREELRLLLSQLGLSAEALVRREEDYFKAHLRGLRLSEEEWLNELLAHPELIQRPIVSDGRRAIIGRPPEAVLALLQEGKS